MKFFFVRFGLAQSLVALVVSFALVISAPILGFASPTKSAAAANAKTPPADVSQSELLLTSAEATAINGGVLLRWSTNSTPDNVGFNIYRVKDGLRTLANRQIIPGSMFGPGTPALMRGGYSYTWFDRGGTANSVYVIESVNVDGIAKTQQQLNAVGGKSAAGFQELFASSSGTSAAESSNSIEKQFPTAEPWLNSPAGTIQDQWAIAGQTSLKIGIKKDGWYRVTQQQMVAVGFNPTVDIRNLRLFVDANEVAIATNQFSGPFRNGDYIEFYGRGLDTPTTDTRIYYLTAGTTPGKRVTGDIQLDSPPVDTPPPTSTPPPVEVPIVPTEPVLHDPIFYSANVSWIMSTADWTRIKKSQNQSVRLDAPAAVETKTDARPSFSRIDNPPVIPDPAPITEPAAEEPAPGKDSVKQPTVTVTNAPALSAVPPAAKVETPAPRSSQNQGRRLRKRGASRKKLKRKSRKQFRQERSHALAADGFAASNFNSTFQIKDRGIYFSNLLNGDEENFFGAVISNPVTLTLQAPNPDLAAVAPATLEFALQGVLNIFTNASHSVSVAFNGVTLGVVDFLPLEHPVRTFPIPAAQILNGANTLKFTKLSTGEVCIVDYARLTYPHLFKADSGSLKFSLLGSQTRTVDGFSVPSVRLIDYTDPLSVKINRPASAPSGAGYAITVPTAEPFSKDQRLLLAIPAGQFEQPASLAVSQPSTLNLDSNAADLVIISSKDFISSFTTNFSPANTSLVAQRQAQGHTVSVVDIEDVYDEFSYGVHGPRAVRDFLQHAFTHWATPPKYVILGGDASVDPRNYQQLGNFDFVPTKLIDATYTEAASDEWFSDFDGDGIGSIPVGRLPVRTLAQANVEVSKIVNFVPANVPQSVMLVADDHTNPPYYYDFEAASDQLGALIPGSLTIQKVYRRSYGGNNCAARADIIAAFNSGRALVNYLGHGSVDVWAGACPDPLPGDPNHVLPEFGSADAAALTNGNKLSFVVVLDCLNGYFHDQTVQGIAEALMNNPNGGSVAAFASSGLTLPEGPHEMSLQLYTLVYGAQPIALGDAIKISKGATFDIDVRTTWIFFGDPSMKIR